MLLCDGIIGFAKNQMTRSNVAEKKFDYAWFWRYHHS